MNISRSRASSVHDIRLYELTAGAASAAPLPPPALLYVANGRLLSAARSHQELQRYLLQEQRGSWSRSQEVFSPPIRIYSPVSCQGASQEPLLILPSPSHRWGRKSRDPGYLRGRYHFLNTQNIKAHLHTEHYNPERRVLRGEFLVIIGTNVLRVFLLAILSHINPPPPLPRAKVVWNWFVLKALYTETSSLRTLKIMPRNLNEMKWYVHEFGLWLRV